MSPKPRVKPYFYWSICSLTFFLFWGCNFVNLSLKNRSQPDFSAPVLYTKNPKKPNPKFFADGSSTYYFLEAEPSKKAGLAAKWEIGFFIYEKDFLSSLKDNFNKETFFTYKLTWKRWIGKLDSVSNQTSLKVNYNSIELGEVEANSLSELLNLARTAPVKKSNTNEYDVFAIQTDFAWYAEEGMTGNDGTLYIWKDEQGSNTNFSSSTSKEKEPFKFSSTNYDYTRNRFEALPNDLNKLFYKTIYSDSKTEIFFVPPFANNSASKAKEPVGFTKIGNFLLKEDMK
ncbi:hypothetical protein [Leptospira ilyithenensis]|uniref:Uncharacterized protein n=1 Tax=Leptospira ilyithenensis TaxID=2484901 RepID=A0A4R9LWZ7_9LEPT|nr:hypothetical protein [Leptospira ilyithenensis]TGN14139.1 hypothetical protein EHS11_02710 [Leptospira ilyithenensis]